MEGESGFVGLADAADEAGAAVFASGCVDVFAVGPAAMVVLEALGLA